MNSWIVTYANDSESASSDYKMTFLLDYRNEEPDVESNECYTEIYFDDAKGALVFKSSFTGRYAFLRTDEDYSWYGEGSVAISDFKGFSIEETLDRKYTYDMKSYVGASFTIFGNEISYETTTPLTYEPSRFLHTTTGGVERSYYYGYDGSIFPSPLVVVTSKADGSKTFEYNGVTYDSK